MLARAACALSLVVGCLAKGKEEPAGAATPASAKKEAPARPPPAQPAPEEAAASWVIADGSDGKLHALLAPIRPGGEVVPGWKLAGIDVAADRASATVRVRKGEREVLLRIIHHESPEDAQARSRSCKMQLVEARAERKASLDIAVRLIETITTNDDGTIWARRGAAATK